MERVFTTTAIKMKEIKSDYWNKIPIKIYTLICRTTEFKLMIDIFLL
jgi:hypothetical protein